MSIRNKLLTLLITGFAVLLSIFFASTQTLNSAAKNFTSDSLAQTYSAAWLSASDAQFERSVEQFDPELGAPEIVRYWDPYENAFDDSGEANPLVTALESDRPDLAVDYFDTLFAEAIDLEQISFVMAYTTTGRQVYCLSGLFLHGADPCGKNARPDFFLNFDSFLRDALQSPTRNIVRITDTAGEKPLSINDSLSFGVINADEESVALVVVGKNLVDNLELFSEDFEVRLAIRSNGQSISLDDYYDDGGADSTEYGVSNLRKLVAEGELLSNESSDATFSEIVTDLGVSITSIPLSYQATAKEISLMIFKDQSASIQQQQQTSFNTYASLGVVVLLVIGVILGLTWGAFGQIKVAIDVLRGMAEGDLKAEMPERNRILASDNDEVGRLSGAIDQYRVKLLEAEEQRVERSRRRIERDNLMFEKMETLASELEGGAKELMLSDIEHMRHEVDTGDDQAKERASIELMGVAFSRMSDEVTSLINARTEELVRTRDEIDSSIRYAARLQNALLPKQYPGDISFKVHWRPRDLVGGDIYFIHSLPDRVYIAVVDCTGHGVPGAFLSIIARSVLERAIDEHEIQNAGDYLTKAHALVMETLSQQDSANEKIDEGFDGGVCIYHRKERRLEFAGAKSSLFRVNASGASEIKGDRKSVGSSRSGGAFQFNTHSIENPEGAFVMLTDGITDVMSAEDRPIAFGRRRVLRTLQNATQTTPDGLVSNIMTNVDLYRGGAPYRDDLTLLAFSINGDDEIVVNEAEEG
jgi:serine phosphatase RsbU (regulator of sigma subunit)/HAMP domain-containing protein